MRICVLSAFEDSMQKDTGFSVRIYNLVKGLAATGNDVKLIIPKYQATREVVEGVTVYGLNGSIPRAILEVLKTLANVKRPTSLYFYDFLFILRVCRLIRTSDVVQIEQQSSGGLLIPLIHKVMKRPVIVDCHDVFQALRVKHTSLLRRVFETFLEKLAYDNADLLLTVSDEEKRYLVSTGFKKCNVEIIPNGVDTSFFSKSKKRKRTREEYGLQGSRIVVFVGNLDYLPNREAVRILSSEIVPKVLDQVKGVKFLVVGKSQEKMELPGLVFTGFVNNVSDILNISDIAVAPLFQGSGTRLKILEYFSCSLPVVSTSVGAQGLAIKDGANIFIEDDLENFALCIIELLKNKNLSTTVGKAARMLATSTYDWTQIVRRLERTLIRLFF
jgi:glycosyltransferase involved in cell wall biosynthesis